MKNLKWIFVVLPILALLILTGCLSSILPPANQPPEITSTNPSSNLTVEVGETKTFSVSAKDPNNDNLTYIWSKSSGTWASDADNNEVTWKAPDEAGLAEVMVKVSDGKLDTKHTWKITVTKPISNIIDVTENITKATTFEGGKIYRIEGSIEVSARLTIKPGTIIKLGNRSQISVRSGGQIIAEGTESLPIIFTSIKDDANGGDTNNDGTLTSPGRGDWGEIIIHNADDSTFKHCNFIYGGGKLNYDSTVRVIDSVVTFENCLFAYNEGEVEGTLSLEDALPGSYVKSSTFYLNTKPIVMNVNLSIDNSNVFHNPANTSQKNDLNAIFISPVTYYITSKVTWAENEVPIVIENDIYVYEDGVLNLGPGVVLKIKNSRIVADDGAIKAIGTKEQPIYFTSINNDSILGDTLGDGNTSPYTEDWEYVELSRTPNNVNEFTYCYFSYGGGGNAFKGVLKVYETNVKLSNCTFAYCNGGTSGALDLSDAFPMTLETCTFTNNIIPVIINEKVSTKNSNEFGFNAKNGIFLHEYAWYFTDNISWLENKVPYVVQDNIEVRYGNTLTLGDDVIIKVFPDVEITMEYGNIIKLGRATFTAYADDTIGGDTDAISATPVKWYGIYDVGEGDYVSWPDMYYNIY